MSTRLIRLAVAGALVTGLVAPAAAGAITCTPRGIEQKGTVPGTDVPVYGIYWVC